MGKEREFEKNTRETTGAGLRNKGQEIFDIGRLMGKWSRSWWSGH
jgi:hypothetical protein